MRVSFRKSACVNDSSRESIVQVLVALVPMFDTSCLFTAPLAYRRNKKKRDKWIIGAVISYTVPGFLIPLNKQANLLVMVWEVRICFVSSTVNYRIVGICERLWLHGRLISLQVIVCASEYVCYLIVCTVYTSLQFIYKLY
jgi:hypothetical protein